MGPWWAAATPFGVARWSGLGVVEVDDQPHAPAGNPDADPGAVVLAVHHVDVVTAEVGLLTLEVQVATEDRALGIARAASEVLCPAVARVAGPAQAVAGVAADEVAAVAPDREPLGIRASDLAADPGIELEGGDVPTAGAAAAAAGSDPATCPRAVHQAHVVTLHGRPAPAAGGTAGRSAAGNGDAARPGLRHRLELSPERDLLG